MADGYLSATGKANLPPDGSSKYNRLFGLAKILHKTWQREPGEPWESLWQLVEVGTVTATDEYDLDIDIINPSEKDEDKIFIRTLDGQKIEYKLVAASDLYLNADLHVVAYTAKKLTFPKAFTSSDAEFGGTIVMPAYVELDAITRVGQDVLVDDPNWLSAAIATRYVFNDRQLNYLYPDLLDIQNDLMTRMKENNERDESIVGDSLMSSVV